jgi:hypothetical protein
MARKGIVTLVGHCPEDSKTCHRHVLMALILSGAP